MGKSIQPREWYDPAWDRPWPSREVYQYEQLLIPELGIVGTMRTNEVVPDIMRPGRHPGEFEVHIIVRGMLSFVCNGQTYHAGENMAFVTMPGELHSGVDNALEPAEWYWVRFLLNQKQPLGNATLKQTQAMHRAMRSLPSRCFATSPSSRFCLVRLLSEHRARTEHSAVMSECLLIELIVGLIRDATDASRRAEQNVPHISPRIRSAMALIDQRLSESISIEDIAAELDLSPSRFRTLFRKEVGFLPIEYLARRRIEAAKNMLARANAPTITHIAFQLGFSSSAYFAAVFKRYVGMTPQQFRAAAQPELAPAKSLDVLPP